MNQILKSNCTIRMRSYIQAGCRLHSQNISNINQRVVRTMEGPDSRVLSYLTSCEDRLKDHVKKAAGCSRRSKPIHVTLNSVIAFMQKEGFKCAVTIMSIPREKRRWCFGCARCKKTPREETGIFWCDPCKRSESIPLQNLCCQLSGSFGEMKGRTYVVNLVAVHHQQRAYKARHRLLAEPAGGASPRLPSIANKVQAIEPNTPGNPNTSVPHIMDAAGSSQTPPQASATDTAPKNDCIYQDLITDEDFGSDDLPDDDKSASPRLPSEQKTESTNQAQNRWLQPPTKNQHPKVCLNQGHKIGCAAMLGIYVLLLQC